MRVNSIFTFVNNLPYSVKFEVFLEYFRIPIKQIINNDGFRIYYVK